ncbi:cation transporter [Methanobrevibacter sp. 87.7]|uniref:heavy metal translocating P-type ATPase n=1 Tax=Methanobrevibacter sp. 87.7 TaxID=387957 RepID=UPI000B65C5B8|nr:cation-translocating P-type ATPase [Methanobrevibacter sp. 87.7]OWT32683.1 cation transporter [Methanobrevibacter sp. 87.7]
MNVRELIANEYKRNGIIILISVFSILLSFLKIKIGLFDFAWVGILLCGIPIIKDAIIGLVFNHDIKADVLVSIGIISSIIIGEVFAAGVISVIMAIGGFLEDYIVNKTESSMKELYDLNPIDTRIILNYNKTNEEEVFTDIDAVKVGDILKVLPGETIPVDGVVIKGSTTIDESPLTGESIPQDKKINSEIFSGTINTFGTFYMKALKEGKNSSIQNLIRLIEESKPENAEIVRQVDKWATWIVVIAFIMALSTWFVTGQVIRAVTVLVVFCPCGLVLATPTAIVAANGNLSKFGILVRNGETIEVLSKIKNIAFDKTGTLTYGKPKVVDILPHGNIRKDELISICASLEKNSEHPIAKSIIETFKKDYDMNYLKTDNFQMILSQGISGRLLDEDLNLKLNNNSNDNKNEIFIGKKDFISKFVNIPKEVVHSRYTSKASSIIYISTENKFLGAIVLLDILRSDSKSVINKLKELNVNSIMLTGDNYKTAEDIASQVDILNFKSNCMPTDKINVISDYQKSGKKIAVIGDGINDGPALKKADVGIAMGGIGSDITVNASDITLVNDDIKYIPHLFEISRKTLNKININIAISLTINFAAMFLAILGIIDPVIGALIHNIGSIIVVLNSSLLLNYGIDKENTKNQTFNINKNYSKFRLQ